LQPLIDELKALWHLGNETHEISTSETFQLKASLMWTIIDFAAYGMLPGWSTNDQLACPTCMRQQKALRLKNGGKFSWFDCHRCFLPRNHAFGRNLTSFRKGRIIMEGSPCRICGELHYAKVQHYPMETTDDGFQLPRFKENEQNWMKTSIFEESPYR